MAFKRQHLGFACDWCPLCTSTELEEDLEEVILF